MNTENSNGVFTRVKDEALQLGAVEVGVVTTFLVGEAQLVVEHEMLIEVCRYTDANIAASFVIGVENSFHVRLKLETAVEEDGAHEGHVLKLVQRHWPL